MKYKLQPFDLFILLSAFLYGNLFVISFSRLNWGFLLIFGSVLVVECFNRILYSSVSTNFIKQTKTKKNFFFFQVTPTQKPSNFRVKQGWFQKIEFFGKKSKIQFCIQNTENEHNFGSRVFLFYLVLNTLKRGFLLGFFIEAFKVGS